MTLQTITPTTHDLGDFKVRRTLPSRGRTMVGPFVFVDQFGPAQFDLGGGMDVRPHPHINLSTVTYLFDGAIDHRDSLGTFATIRPGAANLMTAGSGIVHSERSPEAERQRSAGGHQGRISGMQTWLALPDGKEEIDPAFQHIGADELPILEDSGLKARIIMGELWGKTAPTTQHAQTIYADILLDAGTSVPIEAGADERAVLVALGDAELDGDALERHTLYVLAPGEAMTLRATSDARVMLLGGEAFATQRHVWWNFVSSSKDRIAEAREAWKAKQFPDVPGDSEERIPIPDGAPKTVSYP
ncbi:pirin family protein [Novosphingopyxis sp. YJ-S2-01]|uniref:pirin family protein n=1 Tax=Novosphingopyxis sp. YJ-S2-01 TaxID=2794021 RepID=UPI0018DB84F9|nr:pirin family protein [Novosphingopyxis sp. YJ-S2-01]MBH9537180.1 pirin family protein [Novosphingopyxis sp. YJ-S2-01]